MQWVRACGELDSLHFGAGVPRHYWPRTVGPLSQHLSCISITAQAFLSAQLLLPSCPGHCPHLHALGRWFLHAIVAGSPARTNYHSTSNLGSHPFSTKNPATYWGEGRFKNMGRVSGLTFRGPRPRLLGASRCLWEAYLGLRGCPAQIRRSPSPRLGDTW